MIPTARRLIQCQFLAGLQPMIADGVFLIRSGYEPNNKLVAQAREQGTTYVKGFVIGRSDSVPVRITRR